MAKFNISTVGSLSSAFEDMARQNKKTVMQVIHGDGAEIVKGRIREIIPVSNRNKKSHAKSNSSFKQTNYDFSTELIIGGKYGYLVFPDEGRGVHNPNAQEFMLHGAEASVPDIVAMIESRVGS